MKLKTCQASSAVEDFLEPDYDVNFTTLVSKEPFNVRIYDYLTYLISANLISGEVMSFRKFAFRTSLIKFTEIRLISG